MGLTPKQAKKLKDLAEKEKKSELRVLKQILDKYFKEIDKKGLPYQPFKKSSPHGNLKVLPRTITKAQDRKLREIADKTGRKISELVREAVKSIITC